MTETEQLTQLVIQQSQNIAKSTIKAHLKIKGVKDHYIENLSLSILSRVKFDKLQNYQATINAMPIELFIDSYLISSEGAIYVEKKNEHEPTKHQTPTKNYKDMTISEKNDYFDNHTLEEFKRFKGDI